MRNFAAVYDACVLYPAPLRDLLMRLALSGLFRARWTQRIQREWIDALLRNRPDLSRSALEWTASQMNRAVDDCLVQGCELLEDRLRLPDPGDRHVLAAAILCRAGVIVTFNLRDFPAQVLAPYGIAAQHPDEFVAHAFDLDPASVCGAVREQRSALRNPAVTVEGLFDAFLRQGLARTVASLRPHGGLL